jgi:hypothetical protein
MFMMGPRLSLGGIGPEVGGGPGTELANMAEEKNGLKFEKQHRAVEERESRLDWSKTDGSDSRSLEEHSCGSHVKV